MHPPPRPGATANARRSPPPAPATRPLATHAASGVSCRLRQRWRRGQLAGRRREQGRRPGRTLDCLPFLLDAAGDLPRKIPDSVTGARMTWVHGAATILHRVGHWLAHRRTERGFFAPGPASHGWALQGAGVPRTLTVDSFPKWIGLARNAAPAAMNPPSAFLPVSFLCTGLALTAWIGPAAAHAAAPVTRAAHEDLDVLDIRTRAGQLPGPNLLHNGWGVTPAGTHTRVSDMVLKLVVAPDRQRLVAVSGGFSDTGLTLLDVATREVTQFLPLCGNPGTASRSAGRPADLRRQRRSRRDSCLRLRKVAGPPRRRR